MRRILLAGVVFASLAGIQIARADEGHEGWGLGGSTATTVTGVAGKITALNYNENGAAVDGFLVGTNILLVFPKQVCGGVVTLGKVGDSVTYSGVALTFASGFQTVNVTSYTDGPITYPPAAPPKPMTVTLTGGTITALNYSDNGTVNGFLFGSFTVTAPSGGVVSSPVFVNIGMPSSALAKALAATLPISSVSVTGMLEAPPQCSLSGTPSEVDASSITIGTAPPFTTGGMGMGSFFGHHGD